MKKTLITIIILFTAILFAKFTFAQENFYEIVKGRILLQVESYGEAWYINPIDYKKYYLGRPDDAFDLMRNLGTGITNANLAKIPLGLINYDDQDDDNDGLTNNLETALDTNAQNADSDNDGYADKLEIEHNYNPLGQGNINIDTTFTNKYAGRIFLQVENAGQAWYLNPADQKRYYLGKPADAFTIMRQLSLGITNENINQITIGQYTASQPSAPPSPAPSPTPEPPTCPSCQANSADQVFTDVANAIMTGDNTAALSYFIPEMQKRVEYTLNFLDADGKFTLGNLLASATLSSSTENERVYSTEAYFSLGGYNVPIDFHVQKQSDGSWKLTNL